MLYYWDSHNRNATIELCINVINKKKGKDIKFDFCESDYSTLSVWLINNKTSKHYVMVLWWDSLAKATKKKFDNVDAIYLDNLTNVQYLNLCKYITKELWGIVRML